MDKILDHESKKDQEYWYPSNPSLLNPTIEYDISRKIDLKDQHFDSSVCLEEIWQRDDLHYISSNKWDGISKKTRQSCRKYRIEGVVIRLLGKDHPLCGEYGLFASKRFSPFDIIGEYTGMVRGCDSSGHYVAALEDKAHRESLGLDAKTYGNEMRFINSYMNISFRENCRMVTAYVDTYPHVMIVCTQAIEIGEEILLDYGEEYNNAYLIPKEIKPSTESLSTTELFKHLPEADSSDDD